MRINNLLKTLFLAQIICFLSCQNSNDKNQKNQPKTAKLTAQKQVKAIDTIVVSKKHKPNFIIGDFDGDKLTDTAKIAQNTRNKKYGLKIIFGNNKVEYFGMGNDILKQGFDDLEWVGIFEKAPKGAFFLL